MKKLIVFGPTGRTGLAVLERASTDPEFQVTAYLRKPNKVPDKVRKEIEIITGDIFDAEKVAEALKGKDVVISCLGTGFNLGSTTVISEGLRNVLNGMRKHGLKLITVIGVSSLMPKQIELFPLKKVIADHKRAYEILKTYEDLDWICTAPPEIVNLPFTGTCKASVNSLQTQVVTTHDMADWMLNCSKNPNMAKEYQHQLVGLCSTLGTFTWLTQTSAGVVTIIATALLFGGFYFAYKKLT